VRQLLPQHHLDLCPRQRLLVWRLRRLQQLLWPCGCRCCWCSPCCYCAILLLLLLLLLLLW
jgi:hypothetical protein